MAQQPTFVADITLYIGTDFTQTYVLEDTLSNSLLDLTGYTACCSMRRYPTSSVAGTFNVLFSSDRTEGKISIEMLQANTANLKAGKYFYDIVLQSPSGEKTRPIEGTITVKRAITR
tara:strand:+ start:576 stop:926 length:351 start_codon:yes stop_codon:yes gene_type:complete